MNVMVKAKKQNEGKFHQAIKGITIHTVDVEGCGMLESSECAQLQHQPARGTCCIHRLLRCERFRSVADGQQRSRVTRLGVAVVYWFSD